MKLKPNVELKNPTLNLLIILAVANPLQIRGKLWQIYGKTENQAKNSLLIMLFL